MKKKKSASETEIVNKLREMYSDEIPEIVNFSANAKELIRSILKYQLKEEYQEIDPFYDYVYEIITFEELAALAKDKDGKIEYVDELVNSLLPIEDQTASKKPPQKLTKLGSDDDDDSSSADSGDDSVETKLNPQEEVKVQVAAFT